MRVQYIVIRHDEGKKGISTAGRRSDEQLKIENLRTAGAVLLRQGSQKLHRNAYKHPMYDGRFNKGLVPCK